MYLGKGLVHQGFFFHVPIAAEVLQHLVDECDLVRTESGIGYKKGKRCLDRLTLHPNDTVNELPECLRTAGHLPVIFPCFEYVDARLLAGAVARIVALVDEIHHGGIGGKYDVGGRLSL